MADSNYSGPVHSAFSLSPAPPPLRPQGSETLAPSYPTNSPFSPYDFSPSYPAFPAAFRPPLPDPYGAHGAFPQNPHRQFPAHGAPRPSYYPSPNSMFQHGRNGPVSSLIPGHPHGQHIPASPHADFPEAPNAMSSHPPMDPFMQSRLSNYSTPPLSQWSPPTMQDFRTYVPPHASSALPPNPGRFGGDAMRSSGGDRLPSRRAELGAAETPRHVTLAGRRASYERQHQQSTQATGSSERRASALLTPPARRSNRSISPRTSSRRSFDRYSTDISQPNNNPEAPEGHYIHMHRARRPRTGYNVIQHRFPAHPDPNVPTAAQLAALKDKLRHFLPSNLPEGTSPTCDICQKDFSAKHVLPSEEEEVAVQLPCKHVFGEHCINTWFDTCKTHKNKITCPMCRQLLIEPQRPGHGQLRVLPGPSDEGRRRFFEAFFSDREDRQLLAAQLAAREDGDFGPT